MDRGRQVKADGLYRKYKVERTDGRPVGACVVLELKDPLTHAAIATWARDVAEAGNADLAADLVELLEQEHR